MDNSFRMLALAWSLAVKATPSSQSRQMQSALMLGILFNFLVSDPGTLEITLNKID